MSQAIPPSAPEEPSVPLADVREAHRWTDLEVDDGLTYMRRCRCGLLGVFATRPWKSEGENEKPIAVLAVYDTGKCSWDPHIARHACDSSRKARNDDACDRWWRMHVCEMVLES